MKDDIKQFHRREMPMDPRFGPVELTRLSGNDNSTHGSYLMRLPIDEDTDPVDISECLIIFIRSFS